MIPDVIYRVRANERNEELRYSLRSLANIEHGTIWMVGYRPSWVQGVEHIPGAKGQKWRNLFADLRIACARVRSFQFVLMDDDFYVLRPTTIPAQHRGPLAEHIATAVGAYRLSLIATADFLARNGHREPRSYELHQPMLCNTDQMAWALMAQSDRPMQARTLYGNLYGVPSARSDDVKVYRATDPLPAGPFLSTEDGGFPAVLPVLQRLFPDPCPYERAERMAA